MYELPTPPASGIVTDDCGITWRRNVADTWDPDACSSCHVSPIGGLTWVQLLEQRGTVTAPSPGV